jgi:hypothetical protein
VVIEDFADQLIEHEQTVCKFSNVVSLRVALWSPNYRSKLVAIRVNASSDDVSNPHPAIGDLVICSDQIPVEHDYHRLGRGPSDGWNLPMHRWMNWYYTEYLTPLPVLGML